MRQTPLALSLVLILCLVASCQIKEERIEEQAVTEPSEPHVAEADLAEEAVPDAELAEAQGAAKPRICPKGSVMSEDKTQCLCDGDAMPLSAELQSWFCVDDWTALHNSHRAFRGSAFTKRWRCYSESGCQCGEQTCGFLGDCVEGACRCKRHKTPEQDWSQYNCYHNDHAYLDINDNYFEKISTWTCNQDACRCGSMQCARGAQCKDGQCYCGVQAQPEDFANYECRDDYWLCMKNDGCQCEAQMCSKDEFCLADSCQRKNKLCGNSLLAGNLADYDCSENYVLGFGTTAYAWICKNEAGCQCGIGKCGLGGSCDDGDCQCSEPGFKGVEQYQCYRDLSKADSFDRGAEYYWICNRMEGCRCGTKGRCELGESCDPDTGKCEMREDRPQHLKQYVWDSWSRQWVCKQGQGCACGENKCLPYDACSMGSCEPPPNSTAPEGKCGTEKAPSSYFYECEDQRWVCKGPGDDWSELRSDDGECFCGKQRCELGTQCSGGRCLCDGMHADSAADFKGYRCENNEWLCQSEDGCACANAKAPQNAVCKQAKITCAGIALQDGMNPLHYACEEGKWLCKKDCACGEEPCIAGTYCEDNKCYCGYATVSEKLVNSFQCLRGEITCTSPKGCAYGDIVCPHGSNLRGGDCFCGAAFLIKQSYPDNVHCKERDLVCTSADGCKLHGILCPEGAKIISNKCFCNDVIVDESYPYEFQCSDGKCLNIKGCKCGKKRCAYGMQCKDNTCYCKDEAFDSARPQEYRCVYSGAVCKNPKGCSCGTQKCALEAMCKNGQCLCDGEAAPENMQDYYCSESGWICKKNEGCACADQHCAMNAFCTEGFCKSSRSDVEVCKTDNKLCYGDCDEDGFCSCGGSRAGAVRENCLDGRGTDPGSWANGVNWVADEMDYEYAKLNTLLS
ncbi:MAG: hypothetical protein WC966_12080 [Bradymonadales bacterium]